VELQKPSERLVVGAGIVEIAQMPGLEYLDVLDSRKLRGELLRGMLAALEIEFTAHYQDRPVQ
jgi:hypothetical protein